MTSTARTLTIILFVILVLITLAIVIWAGRRTRNATDFYAGKSGRLRIDFAGAGNRDAKFIFRLTGCNLRMCLGVDIGINPKGDRRCLAGALREGREQRKFRLGFDIKT